MKKTICLLLILVFVFSLVALSACHKPVIPPADLDDTEKENTTLEKPEGKTPDQLSAKESLYVAVGELERSGGFTALATGSTTSLMGIAQSISAQRTVVGNNVFKQSTSFSAFVKSGEQLYVYGENYLVRKAKSVSGIDNAKWENTATKYSKEAWNQLIGYRPNGLTGYVLNDNTILDAFLVSAENGLYTFRYVLDTEKAPHYLLYEMRHNANSEKFPYFTKAEIEIVMDENFIVKTLSTDCEYRASSGGLSDLPCKENLTETFNVGYKGDLPQKAFFEQFFDASTVDQVEEKQETALDVLTSMLDEYLTKGKTLNAKLTVSQSKREYINALVALNVDLNNLEALTFNAKVGKNLYLNYANNRVLVDFQAFKGSTTIDGVLQYVSSLFTDPFGGTIDFSIDTDALLKQMTYEIKNDVARVSLPFNIANLHVEANLYGTVQEKGVYKFRNAVLGIGNLVVRLVPGESWEVPSHEGEYPEILSLTKLLNNGKIAMQTEILDTAAKVMLDAASQNIFVNTDYFDCAVSGNILYANVGNAKIRFDLNAVDTILGMLPDFAEMNLPLPQAEASPQSILDVLSNLTATKQGENTVLSLNVDGMPTDVVLVEQADGWWVDSVKVNLGEQQLVLTPSELFDVLPLGNTSDYADITQAAKDFVPKLSELKNAESYKIDLDTVWQFRQDSFAVRGDAVVQPYGEKLALDVNFEIVRNNEQIIVGNAVLLNNYLYLTVNDAKVAVSVADLGNGAEGGELQNLLSALPIEINNNALKSVADKIQSIVERIQQGVDVSDLIDLLNNIGYGDFNLTLGLDGQLFGVNNFDLVASVLNKGVALSIDGLLLGEASVSTFATVSATEEQVVVDCPEDYTTDIAEIIASRNYELAMEGKLQLGSELYDISAFAVRNDNGNMQISALMSYGGVPTLDVTAYIFGNKLYAELDGVRFVTTLPEGEGSLQGDSTDLADILSVLRGKNEYLDKLLNYVETVADKAQNGELSADKLLKKIVIGEESVSVILDGTELCIAEMALNLSENGITLSADGFAYEDICADINVCANFSEKVVTEPTGDWHTYLAVKLDQHNTLFANLDLLNGVFVFKLENDWGETYEDGTIATQEPLYIEYTFADNFVRLKKGDVKICGDVQEIADFVKYVDNVAKDFAEKDKDDSQSGLTGDTESSLGDLAELTDIDISKLLQELSVELSVDKASNNATLQLSALNLSADVYITNQNGTAIDHADVSLGNTTYRVTPCEPYELPDFGNKKEYLDIAKVAAQFVPSIEQLRNTENFIVDFGTMWHLGGKSYGLYGDALVQPCGEKSALNVNFEVLLNNKQIVVGNAVLLNNYVYLTINGAKVAISAKDLGNGTDGGELQNLLSALPIELNNKALNSVTDKIHSIVERVKQGFDLNDVIGLLNNISYDRYHLTLGLDGQLFDVNDFDLVATVLRRGFALTVDDLLLGDADVYAVAMLRATEDQVVMDCPEEYTTDISKIIASLNCELAVDGKVILGSELYDISASATLNDNGNKQISALMSYDGVQVLDVTAYVCGNKLYVELDGVRFVTNLSEGEGGLQSDSAALDDIVSALRGKNEYLDKLINYVEEIEEKAQKGELSADKLLKKIVIDNEGISVVLDGTELYVSNLCLNLSENGITLSADGFAYEDIYADVSVGANFSDKVVAEPDGDWNTYLSVKLDEHNTLFANLDLLNGLFVFKVENDLPETSADGTTTAKDHIYIEYTLADNSILLKKGDVKICGDVQEIADFVEYVKGLVKDFAGQINGEPEGSLTDDSQSGLGELAALLDIDISKLLNVLSTQISVDKASDNATLQLSALNLSADVYITNQKGTAIDYVDLSIGNTTCRVTPCEPFELPDFGDKEEYVNLNEVIGDYRSTIEALANTHSWTFDFNGDSQIDVIDQQGNTTSYLIAAGSYVKVYFNLAQPQDIMLRANIVLKQLKDGAWEDFLTVDAALIDGRIYITYNETLKYSISLEAAIAKGTDQENQLLQTDQQPDGLLNNLSGTNEAQQNANNDFLAILKGISYDKQRGALCIVLNGKLISEKLGDITIFTSRTENTLTFTQLSLTYDNISVNLCDVTISASELTQLAEGETVEHDYEKYVVAQEILQYFNEHGGESAHLNFDSLQELLQALKDAANKDNPQDSGI